MLCGVSGVPKKFLFPDVVVHVYFQVSIVAVAKQQGHEIWCSGDGDLRPEE